MNTESRNILIGENSGIDFTDETLKLRIITPSILIEEDLSDREYTLIKHCLDAIIELGQ